MLQFLLLLSVISITIAQLPPSDDIPRLWPKPASIISISNALNLNADPSSFTIVATSTDDVLDDAIQNIRGRIFSRSSGFYDSSLSGIDLETLEVSVKQTLTPTTYPSLGDDESYTLHIGETSTLESNTTWGALRGLETFSQLFTMNRGFTITSGNGMLITDSPRFPWRGLMLDPARHFMSVEKIKKQIGAMSQSKLNVLHLHLSDGESFTVNTEHWERYGNISKFGSYSPALTYSQSDLNDIVSFGRLKGVRVVPEFDLPAHMASWAIAYPELMAHCPTVNPHPEWPGYYSPADVTEEAIYDAMDELLSQLSSIFVDDFWHVGGDEPHYDCWDADPSIAAFRDARGMTNVDLYNMFEQRLGDLIEKQGKTRIGWDEVWSNGGDGLEKDAVVEIWQGNDPLPDVVSEGRRAIVSSDYYLDYQYDWSDYYQKDPMSYLSSTSNPKLLLGGESCMWMSGFDASSNLDSALWPNAAAVAEQLWWTSVGDDTVDEARTRLSQHRCRLVRGGLGARPIAEDYCGEDIYVRKSLTYCNENGDYPIWSDGNTPPP